MKKLTILTLLCFVLLLSVTPVAAIVYGDLDGENHPSVGLMSRPDPSDSSQRRPVCTGTLISARVFLTAGHCIIFLQQLNLSPADIKVSFNSENGLDPSGLLSVSTFEIHDEYDPNSNKHDVGALILSADAPVPPAQLAPEGFLGSLERKELKEKKFTVVGYGATLEFPPPNVKFPDGKRRVAVTSFQTLLPTQLVLKQKSDGDGGICDGDSGGPAIYDDNGQELIVGITSTGDNFCLNTSSFYRTDIADTLDFINGLQP